MKKKLHLGNNNKVNKNGGGNNKNNNRKNKNGIKNKNNTKKNKNNTKNKNDTKNENKEDIMNDANTDSSFLKKPNFLKDFCIMMPNMGMFIFYALFVLCVPVIFLALGWDELIALYMPLLVPLSIIFTISGDGKYFKNLYPQNGESKDLEGYISKHLLNLMALVSIIYVSVNYGIENNNVLYGALIGVTSAILLLFIAPEIIPFGIEKGDKYIKKNMNLNLKYDWHKYSIGLIILILIVILETLLIEVVYQNVLRTH